MNLVFDLDGTLVDSRLGLRASLDQAVKNVFTNIDPGTLEFKIGPTFRVIMHQALGQVSPEDMDRLEKAFRAAYDEKGWKACTLYPETRKTLQELCSRGAQLFLVTNKPLLPTHKILAFLDLSAFFQDVVCSDSQYPRFQDKTEALRFLLKKNHLDAKNTLYIGDTSEDLSAAEACSVAFVGLQYGYGPLPKRSGIRLFNNIKQLLDIRYP